MLNILIYYAKMYRL